MSLKLDPNHVPEEGWRTLRAAIPDGESEAVARRLHRHPDYIRRWRCEPFSDDAPLSNGQQSPLDKFCDLLDAVFLSSPPGAWLILAHVKNHYERLVENALNSAGNWNRREHAAKTLQEAVEAVNCLNLDAPNEVALRELLEARSEIDLAILKLMNRNGSSTTAGRNGG
jgi:hypothetical protein